MFTPFNEAVFERIEVRHSPFRHLFSENILNHEFLLRLQAVIAAISDEHFGKHASGYRFAHYPDEDFIRFVYSQPFLQVIGRLFGRPVRPSKQFFLPQVYIFPENYRGLPPHTDASDKRDLAMIFYIAQGWDERCGGELRVLNSDKSPYQVFSPVYNSMSCMELFEKSWHEVLPVKSSWIRKTLIIDFDYL
ncbi:2OG-Fe(II) oxygenase [Photorhabdus bodei]|nr:2OG-Fe(II) oxygenase [Photorhabdus bodei]